MRSLIVIIAVLTSLTASGQSGAAEEAFLEFKGFVFGKTTLSEWRAAAHETAQNYLNETITIAPYCAEDAGKLGILLRDVPKIGIQNCWWYAPSSPARPSKKLAVGPISTINNNWVFLDGVLAEMMATFHSAHIQSLVSPLTAKYGQPRERLTEELQNAFGAKFVNETYIWNLDAMNIVVSKYAGDLKTGMIVISSPELSDEINRRKSQVPVSTDGL